MTEYHRPIMLDEVVRGLNVRSGGLYFDGTVGGGGHSFAILSADPAAHLIATDKDGDAIVQARQRLAPFDGRFRLERSDFKNFSEVLLPEDRLDGFLLDLGVSSHQIDDPTRGFAYRMGDAPLDMRMDKRSSLTARDVVNGYGEEALRRILKEYGEEPFANVIAKGILREREKKPIETCGELRSIVENALPPKFRGAACARQTFQAIRIEVNGELDGLEACIRGLIERLKVGGRAVVLTFHSLEDRIVKNVFRDLSTACTCPKSFPVCVCGRVKRLEILTKKPITASEEEQKENPRSKSAKLRIAEKIAE